MAGTSDLMIIINMDYDDLIYALQKDKRFERYIDNIKDNFEIE